MKSRLNLRLYINIFLFQAIVTDFNNHRLLVIKDNFTQAQVKKDGENHNDCLISPYSSRVGANLKPPTVFPLFEA